MKKLAILVLIFSLYGCKKDPLDAYLEELQPVEIPNNILGKWQWFQSIGGYVGGCIKDSTRLQTLTIETNNKVQMCINESCFKGKYVYGSRSRTFPNKTTLTDTVLIIKLPNIYSIQSVFRTKQIKDTMEVSDACNDCFNHFYSKVK